MFVYRGIIIGIRSCFISLFTGPVYNYKNIADGINTINVLQDYNSSNVLQSQ